ncbi:MAG: AMMECR1 domain-containing protein [Candidatus Sericytochromatia bacterium]|nr:AMMECR1 domain-containing protein [Candidatus Tanganyikabacteria bacterium]
MDPALILFASLLAELRSDSLAAREAADIALLAARARLAGRAAPAMPPIRSGALRRPGGAFVTVVRDGKVRGCWGSVYASAPDLAREIAGAAAKAVASDYRHRPVSPGEWGQVKLVVSVVGPLRRLQPGERTDPLSEGLLVTSGSRGGVMLPGEARSYRYQRAESLRKAGLAPAAPAASYAFETWVAEVDTGRSKP